MSKKGEITSTQIIALILAIIGFAVVLILLWSLEFQNYSDEEVCRLSVLSRATVPESAKGIVPLKCTTGKICITDGKGKCAEEFLDEKNVKIVKIPENNPTEAARILEKTVVESQYYCWEMMGEGKLDLFTGADNIEPTSLASNALNFKSVNSKCLICSRIVLDKEISSVYLNSIFSAGQYNPSRYMAENNIPDGDITYLQKFTDSDIRGYPSDLTTKVGNQGEVKATRQLGVLFFQILTPTSAWDAFTGTTIKSGAFVLGGSYVTGATKLFTKPAGAILGISAILGAGGFAAWQTYDNRVTAQGYCGQFAGEENGKNGCSLITTFDYNNPEIVNNQCAAIEGSP
jgi:hypothetical protein